MLLGHAGHVHGRSRLGDFDHWYWARGGLRAWLGRLVVWDHWNASFMPWLVGLALLHSLAVTEKRGVFKAWTIMLAIFAFALSLARSGTLWSPTSVHSFAADPTRGLVILAILGIIIGIGLCVCRSRLAFNR